MLFELSANLTQVKVVITQLSWSPLPQYHVHVLAFDENNTTHSQNIATCDADIPSYKCYHMCVCVHITLAHTHTHTHTHTHMFLK